MGFLVTFARYTRTRTIPGVTRNNRERDREIKERKRAIVCYVHDGTVQRQLWVCVCRGVCVGGGGGDEERNKLYSTYGLS